MRQASHADQDNCQLSVPEFRLSRVTNFPQMHPSKTFASAVRCTLQLAPFLVAASPETSEHLCKVVYHCWHLLGRQVVICSEQSKFEIECKLQLDQEVL